MVAGARAERAAACHDATPWHPCSSSIRADRSCLIPERGGSTAFHLGRVEIFLPRQQHPDVAERVAHTGGVGAVKHLGRWLDFFPACLNGAPQKAFVVVSEDVETRSAAP